MAAHVVLPWVHRIFSLVKRWGLGTYHGLRRKHVDTYLNEFVFRYNRRFYRHASFETILGLASHHESASYWDIIGRANPRQGIPALRRAPRRRKQRVECAQTVPAKSRPTAKFRLQKPDSRYMWTALGQRDKLLVKYKVDYNVLSLVIRELNILMLIIPNTTDIVYQNILSLGRIVPIIV